MAGKALNPADVANTTSTKPTYTNNAASGRTWFKDCTSPAAADGTEPLAQDLNNLLLQMRYAADQLAVSDDDDETLLYKLFQAASAALAPTAYVNLPLFPEITATGNVFTFTTSTGQIVINTGLTWTHRGWVAYATSSFAVGDRTFATNASKTYHLRWYKPGHANAPLPTYPNGRFMLRDLADSGYNPGALAETSPALDTTHDDMLVARVVTNASNVLTVTALKNLDRLNDNIAVTLGSWSNSGANDATGSATVTYNWARNPFWQITETNWSYNQSASIVDLDRILTFTEQSRYKQAFSLLLDNMAGVAMTVRLQA